MRSLLQRCALVLGAVVGLLGTRPATANAQKALVYCPVSIDATGCNAIVAALTGPAYPLGVDRGYDGTDGTVDLKAVDLFSYSVFVVPSLADDSTSQPYAKLRDPEVAEHLKAALIGRIAMWSGTPDQGATNRTMKDALIQNLAAWSGGAFATAKGPGLVALLDMSASVVSRYDWVRGITPVPVTSDPALLIYNNVRALNQRATTILTSGAGAIVYDNMATFGFQLPNGAPGVNLDAVGQTGTSQGGQVVLLTMEAGNASGAIVKTDRDDYGPGDPVTITGSGWQAGEAVRLTLHMDPLRDSDTELTATADGSGNFTNTSFSPGNYDIGVRFVVTALGQTSGLRAQTTFTDGNKVTFSTAANGNEVTDFGTVGLNACIAAFVQERQGSNIDTGPHAARAVSLSAVPNNITFHNNNACGGGANQVTSVTIPANQPAVAFWFKVTGGVGPFTITGAGAGLGGNNNASATVALPIATTLTLSTPSPASVAFGSVGPVSLTATLTRTTGGAGVQGATVTFSVDGGAVSPTATTNASGVATISYNPSSLATGSHSVQASFAGGTIGTTTFGGSTSGTQQLTVGKAAATVTLANLSHTYDRTAKAATAATTPSGLAVTFAYTLNGNPVSSPTNAGNYGVTATINDVNYQGSTTGTLTIAPKSVTASFTSPNKVYDGTTVATIADPQVSGVIAPDIVTLTGGTANFADKNVGTAKIVTATGFALGGADAANYVLSPTPVTCAADITAKALTGAITASNKVYDGTTTATASAQPLSGVIIPDAASLVVGTANFDSKFVGTGKTVTAGLTLSGADAGNYTVNATATATANITALGITGGFTAANRAYDGTTAAMVLTRSLTGTIGGDALSLTGGVATFNDKNVGTGKTVTLAGANLTGADAGNYTLTSVATATANITAVQLVGGFTAQDKVYDGTTAAMVLTRTLTGVVSPDIVNLAGGAATFDNKNVGTAKVVTLTGAGLTGADAGNYTVNPTATSNANITALGVTGAFTAASRVYDGTTNATVLTRSVVGAVSGDAVGLTSGTAAFGDKNVGTGKTVTLTGAVLSGTDAANYTLGVVATTTADITARTLTVSAIGANKIYDGTTAATVTLSDNRVSGDVIATGYTSAAFANKNVGTGKTVTVSGISVTGGADQGNYALAATTASTTADITALGITGSFTASNKIYDGNTSASILTRSLSGTITGDAVSLDGGSATFDNKNVGTSKTVTGTGFALGGGDAGNYTLTSVATTTANITTLAITGNITAANKVYDGTTAATIASRTLAGVITGDNVSYVGGTATFGDKNVGSGKTVSATGLTLSGGDAGNYTVNATATTTADITARTLTVTAHGVNKVYDGTTAATATFTDDRVSGDVLTVAYSSAAFADKNVGTAKTVTVTGVAVSGSDAGNYNLATTATTAADITALGITGHITAASKVYDGNTSATILTRTLSGVIGGDIASYVGGTATFDDKNAGMGKTVTATGLGLSGSDAGNYTVNSTATATANITPLGITGSFTAGDKIYDGNTSATVMTRTLAGVLGTDAVSLIGGTATFDTKNVGTGKTVTLTGVTLAGSDAVNYSLTSVSTTTGDITALAITGHITADSKVYDGTTAATIASRTLTGQVSGDAVTYVGGTANFDTKDIGIGKTVTGAGLNLSGADAGNYTVNTTATSTADITPKGLTGSITAANKTYDGNTSATILTRTLSGVIGSEAVTYVGGTATFDNKNVGTGKAVSATGLSLSGADAGNYTVNTSATTTANISQLAITGSITAANKVYDGGTSATILTRTLAGAISGDDVSYTGGTATFANKNAGMAKTVTGTGLGLAGGDAGNYTVNSTATTTANITPATPTVNWANPANIIWPAPLTSTQLNATVVGVLAEVPTGSFTYTPASGTVLMPGTSTLSVAFTSSDANYTNATGSASITVLDKTAPIVSNTAVTPNPVAMGTSSVTLTSTISDASTGGSKITGACYRIDGGACTPVNTFAQQVTVNVSANIPIPNATDVIEVCVYGTDAGGNTNAKFDCALIAVYDPSGGFVTGGGWINSPAGAYVANPGLTGKATFGFVSKYKKGQTIPDGNTEFQFEAAGFNFKSTSYEWLVVSGTKAQYKGSGTINGSGDYFFMLTATDADVKGKGPDTFRMKVWNKTTNAVIYDNQIGLSDSADPTTILGGGSIQIHQ